MAKGLTRVDKLLGPTDEAGPGDGWTWKSFNALAVALSSCGVARDGEVTKQPCRSGVSACIWHSSRQACSIASERCVISIPHPLFACCSRPCMHEMACWTQSSAQHAAEADISRCRSGCSSALHSRAQLYGTDTFSGANDWRWLTSVSAALIVACMTDGTGIQ